MNAIFTDKSYLSGTGGYLGDFISILSRNKDVISDNDNGIAFFDFNNSTADILGNYSTTNVGDLGIVKTINGKGLNCDGIGRLIIGSGSTLLGGRNEFLVYLSYKVKKGDNTGYNMGFTSYGATAGYNFKLQHSFIDLNNPSADLSTQDLDDGSSIGAGVGIHYDFFNKIIFSAKDGKYVVSINREIIDSGDMTGNIRSDRLDGLGLCARPGGGYSLKGVIDTFYVSSSGVDENGVDSIYSLFDIYDK